MVNKLTILQWNIQSFKSNHEEFKRYLEKSNFQPDIICLQETLVPKTKMVNLPNYNVIVNSFDEDGSRGTAICVKKSIPYFDKKLLDYYGLSVKLILKWEHLKL